MHAPATPPPPQKSHPRRKGPIGIGLLIVALIGAAVGHAAGVGGTVSNATNPSSVNSRHTSAHTSTPSGTAISPSPSGPVELQLGDPAEISQAGADSATILVSRRVASSKPADQFSNGPQNGYFVSVRVTVSAAADLANGFDINPLDFYALSGRTHYDEGDGNAFEGPHNVAQLDATTLNAGETASGWLLFDLPSPHGEIVYAPNLDGQPLANWTF